ncbi:MAG: hypothetical protein AB7V18_19485 [Pyrinomonadaceae bacterium]
MLTANVHRSPFRRYLATNSTAADFDALLTKGNVLSKAQLDTFTVFPVGKSLTAQFIFFGSDAANETFTYRVWLVYRCVDSSGNFDPETNIVINIGAGTATLGTANGSTSGTAILDAELIADNAAWVTSGIATTSAPNVVGPGVVGQTAFSEGSAASYSATSANDDVAPVYLPSLLRATGIIVDFKLGTAASANCLIQTDEV